MSAYSFDVPPPPPAVSMEECTTPAKKRRKPADHHSGESPINWLAGKVRMLSDQVVDLKRQVVELSESKANAGEPQSQVFGDDCSLHSRVFELECAYRDDHGLLMVVADGSEKDFSELRMSFKDLKTFVDRELHTLEANLEAEFARFEAFAREEIGCLRRRLDSVEGELKSNGKTTLTSEGASSDNLSALAAVILDGIGRQIDGLNSTYVTKFEELDRQLRYKADKKEMVRLLTNLSSRIG